MQSEPIFMKNILLILFLLFLTNAIAQVNPNYHKVQGYFRSDGTYVKSHFRTNQNNTNTDNYTTKPNTNPHTGEKGYIEPNYGSTYSPLYSSSYRNYNYSKPNLNSSISFSTNYGYSGAVNIWIDNKYYGSLNEYFSTGTPNCGQEGTLTIPVTSGIHRYRAEDATGFYWEGTINSNGSCSLMKLSSSAERRYTLGLENAKENYQPSFLWAYVYPFTFTALSPEVGIPVTTATLIWPLDNRKFKDPNYSRGFKKGSQKRRIIHTIISTGLGFLTHEFLLKDAL
jgi:hypothetical protein